MVDTTISPVPKFSAYDANGDPYVGAKLYTYQSGTTIPNTTWTDSTKATPNPNPITLDSKGQADVWIDSTNGKYRYKLVDPDGVTVFTVDGIESVGISDLQDDIAAAVVAAQPTSLQQINDQEYALLGSIGENARVVNLTADTLVFTYDENGENPTPALATITATAFNYTGVVYYDFLLNGTSVQNGTGTTYSYTPQTDHADMPDLIECRIRENSETSAIKAKDQITIVGIKPGMDAIDGITIVLTNEAHTLPTTNAGTVTYTGSGTDILVWEGATQLTVDQNTPYANSTFRVTDASGTYITPGTPSGTDGASARVYGDHSSMTQDRAVIVYTIVVKNSAGEEATITKRQTFAKSWQGDDGAAGASGPAAVYRGTFTDGETYYYTEYRRDIVYYSGTYYIYNVASDSAGNVEATWTLSDWEVFSATFESVATKILLAENAAITTSLFVGGGTGDNTCGMSGVGSDSSSIRMWAGSSTPSSAPFRVQQDGTVVMTAATIGSSVSISGTTASTVVSNAANGATFTNSSYVTNTQMNNVTSIMNGKVTTTYVGSAGGAYLDFSSSSFLTLYGGNGGTGSALTLDGTTCRISGISGTTNLSGTVVLFTTASSQINYSAGTFRPTTGETVSLGASGYDFNTLYITNVYQNGSLIHDVFDDLEVLHSIKPLPDGKMDLLSLPKTFTSFDDAKKAIKKDVGDMMTDKEIEDSLSDHSDMASRVKLNTGEFINLVEGAVRQLDRETSSVFAQILEWQADIERRLKALESKLGTKPS